MLPIFTIPPAVIESQPQQPLAVAEKDGVRVEVLEVARLGERNVDFLTRTLGENISSYDFIEITPSIELKSGLWARLDYVKLDPSTREGRWFTSGTPALLDEWTGKVALRITNLHFDAELIRLADERAREDERRTKIQKQPKAIQNLLIDRKIKLGFTKEQVRLSWGEPESVNSTVNAHGATEQWVYGLGDYVYLTNGKVVSWQTHR